MGRVDHGDTFLESYELERSRGRTIFSKQAIIDYKDTHITSVSYTHLDVYKRQVLKKAGYDKKVENIDYSVLADDAAADVCKTIALFNDKIKEAANRYEPSVIARYLVDVAQSFNKFYHDNIILADDENVKNARLALVDAVRTVIKSGLAILGIDAPEQM